MHSIAHKQTQMSFWEDKMVFTPVSIKSQLNNYVLHSDLKCQDRTHVLQEHI